MGITAGASTPGWIIKEVKDKMSEEMNNAMEIEESFADMLEKSIKTLNTGDKVTGVVTGITATEVNVDLGTKHAGYIPMSELSDDPAVKPEDIVKVGDDRDLCHAGQRCGRGCHPVQEAPGQREKLGHH